MLADIKTVLGGQVGRALASSASAMVIAALVGPAARGRLALVVGVATIGSTVLSLGAGGAATYYLAGNRWTPQDGLGALGLGSLVSSASVATIAALYSYYQGPTVLGVSVWIIALATITMTISGTTQGVLLGLRCFAAHSMQSILTPVLVLTMFIGLRTCGIDSTGQAVWSWIGGVLCASVASGVILARAASWRPRVPSLLGQAVWYGVRTSFAAALNTLNLRLDSLMLASLAGAYVTGQYALAVQFSEVVWLVPTAVGYVLFTAVAGAPADAHRTARVSRQTLTVALLGCLMAVLGVWVFGMCVPQYAPAVVAAVLLIPGTISFCVAKVIGNDLLGRGMPHPHMWAAAAAGLVTVAGNLVFVPRFGMPAAAMVSSVAYSVYAAAIVQAFSKATGIGALSVAIPRWDESVDLVNGAWSMLVGTRGAAVGPRAIDGSSADSGSHSDGSHE